MSDQPPHDGWWQASDGNWYPPESRPGAGTAPAPVPPQPAAPTPPAQPPPVWTPPTNSPPLPPTSAAGGGFVPPPVPEQKPKSNRGCLIGLAVLVILIVLGVGALVAGGLFVKDKVDTAIAEEGLGDGGITGLLGGDCLRFQAAFISLTGMSMFGIGGDLGQQEQMDETIGQLQELAPEEIRDEMNVLGDAFRRSMQTAMAGGGGLSGETSSDAEQEAAAILEEPEVVDAKAAIDNWVLDNCG